MTKSNSTTNNELDESRNRRISSLRQLPKSWIIIAVVFYCASLVTVGLLAGLLPRRIEYVTVLETSSLPTTVTQDPSECVEDECSSRLVSDLMVDMYELEYICNDIKQTTMEGRVTIHFQLRQPIKQLIYHVKDMIELEEAMLFENDVQHTISMKRYLPNDYLSLRLVNNSLFPNGQYKLKQKFVINLLNPSIGFYQSLFQDKNQING